MALRLGSALLLIAAAALHAGCITERETRPVIGDAAGSGAEMPAHLLDPLDFTFEPLGQVPNTGALLPLVSPDGEWIAYLAPGPNDAGTPINPLTGEGLDRVALRLAPLNDLERASDVATSGAAWAAFTDDSSTIIALRTVDGRCELIVRDTRHRRRFDLPWPHAVTPAPSPRGERVALAAVDGELDAARVHVVDAMSGEVVAAAPRGGRRAAWQIAPRWVDDGSLVYIESVGGRAVLQRWQLGSRSSETLGVLHIEPATPAGAVQALASVAAPLSPDRRHFAYYASGATDRLLVQPIGESGARPRPLTQQSRAGAWLDAEVLVVAGGQALTLTTHDGRTSRPLFAGRALPRWAGADPTGLVVLLPARDPTQFDVLRLHVTPRAPE